MARKDNEFKFTDCSADAIDIVSTWGQERPNKTCESAAQTDLLPSKRNQETSTNTSRDASAQTSISPSFSVKVDENALAAWLKRIYPAVAEELLDWTPALQQTQIVDENEMVKVQRHQTIAFSTELNAGDQWTQSAFCWLCVVLENVSILVMAASQPHQSWCDHQSFISVWMPKRNTDETASNHRPILFTELKCIPVTSCVQVLATNAENKDYFAGGTISGDLYVWKYDNTASDITEVMCKTSQNGIIVDLAWLKGNAASQDHLLAAAFESGIIEVWKIGRQIVQGKLFAITSRMKANENEMLTSMLTISNTDILVGTNSGRLILCSVNQIHSNRGNSIHNDPIIAELTSHKFPISTLIKTQHLGKDCVVSCDLSGKLMIHSLIDEEKLDTTPTINLPLPFKQTVSCSSDGKYIFCPGSNGTLEIYNVRSGKTNAIEGQEKGIGNSIKRSDNGYWLATGTYAGTINLFTIEINT